MTAPGILVMLKRLEIRASLIIRNDDFAVQNSFNPEFPK
jgi:hypothetical protein